MSDGSDYISIQAERIKGIKAPRRSLDVRIVLENGTVVDADVIRLQSFSGQESISNLFEFKLDLRVNDYTYYDSSPEWMNIEPGDPGAKNLDFDQLLGASITVTIGLAESEQQQSFGSDTDGQPKTHFNGIIQNVSLLDRGVWNITMAPRLFMLKLQSSYRIFSDKTILDVISEVLSENQIVHTSYRLLDNGQLDESFASPVVTGLAVYRKQDWLQAGETDFDFLQRLLNKAGLLYYFVHSVDRHIMVITDTNYYQSLWHHQDKPLKATLLDGKRSQKRRNESLNSLASKLGGKSSLARALQDKSTLSSQLKPARSLKKLYLTSATLGQDLEDSISQFNFQRSLAVNGVSTVLAHKEANWETQDPAIIDPVYKNDATATRQEGLAGEQISSQPRATKPLNMEKLLVVSFGASEYELDIRRQLIEKKLLSARTSLSGSSSYAGLQSGYIFQLEDSRPQASSFRHDGSQRQGSQETFRPEVANKRNGLSSEAAIEQVPRKMVAISVSHNASIDGKYSNQFTALDASGFGLPYEASGDSEGTVIAQVCSSSGDTLQASADSSQGVGTTKKSALSGLYYLPKEAFSERSQKIFIATSGKTDTTYTAQGLYVRFVTQAPDSAPLWVRLADSMTTIPELGAFVLIGRARDETELPEIQQVLDSNGARNVLPKEYSKSTSWGNSYSMSYGDSSRISVPMVPKTAFDIATAIVEDQTKPGLYTDVSFSENSAFSFSVSGHSRSVSVTGPIDEDYSLAEDYKTLYHPSIEAAGSLLNKAKSLMDSYGISGSPVLRAVSRPWKGKQLIDTYVSSSPYLAKVAAMFNPNDSASEKPEDYVQISESTTFGDTYNATELNGKSYSYNFNYGHQHSETHSHGGSYTKTVQSGLQDSVTHIHGASNTSTYQTGNAYTYSENSQTNNVSLVGTSNATTTTVASNNTTITGASNNSTVTGVSNSTSMQGIASSMEVNALQNTISVTGIHTKITVLGLEHTGINIMGTSVDIDLPFLKYKNHAATPAVSQNNFQINMIVAIKIEL